MRARAADYHHPMPDDAARATPCPGCGALVPESSAETHPYIGASPNCWAVYASVLGREYGELGFPAVHRLTVDAYAAQHPGEPSRRSIQSVAVHLVALDAVIERRVPLAAAVGEIRRALARPGPFTWLEPPSFDNAKTIFDVAPARDLAEHDALVRRWADSVWRAWSPHHATIRAWST